MLGIHPVTIKGIVVDHAQTGSVRKDQGHLVVIIDAFSSAFHLEIKEEGLVG